MQYRINIIQDLIILKAQNHKSPFLQEAATLRIILFMFWRVVNRPIYFDHETGFAAKEIHDKAINRLLTTKTKAH